MNRLPLSGAPAFSIGLSINGNEIKNFGRIGISYSANGYGMSGICAQTMTVQILYSEWFAAGVELFGYGDEVIISIAETSILLPKFYLSSRRILENAVEITCYDITMFTNDKPVLDGLLFDDEDCTYTSDVFSAIGTAMSSASGKKISVNPGSVILTGIPKIPRDQLNNKNCREILSGLSAAACGIFAASADGQMDFFPFASDVFTTQMDVDEYSKIIPGLKKECLTIIISNGSEIFSTPIYSSDEEGKRIPSRTTVTIDTPYASRELLDAVAAQIKGKVYKAWSCSDAVVPYYPPPGTRITFADGSVRTTNYLSLVLSGSGMRASFGRNEVLESEYLSSTKRELLERIKVGEVNGNTKISRNGIKFVYKNENSGAKTEYGFDVSESGVTSFEGAVIDKVMPEKIEKISETKRRIVYNGKIYELSWSIDPSTGDKINIQMSEVTE